MSENNSNENSVILDNFINNNRLTNEYEVSARPSLGHGTYGVVIKARNKIDDKEYAIKMIAVTAQSKPDFEDEKSINEDFNDKIKELKIWARLDLDYCVQYRSAWLERDDKSKERFLKFYTQSLTKDYESDYCMKKYKPLEMAVLHIQMDLCSMSLKRAITQFINHFKCSFNMPVCRLAYYIFSEILGEILEAINYLHSQQPPIIHRDVKPDNILIKLANNGSCLKLGDFGLAVLHEAASQTHTRSMGSEQYMAPEVRSTRKYSTKADIYSIGIIIQKMLNFNINGVEADSWEQHYQNIVEIVNKATSGVSRVRPTCKEILIQRNDWTLEYSGVQQEIMNMVDLNAQYDIKEQFVLKFLQTKHCKNVT